MSLLVLCESLRLFVNLIQDGHFWGCSRMGAKKVSTPIKSVTHILQ